MGAYSSWGIFSLCHHLIVQMSAKQAGFRLPYNRYMLLRWWHCHRAWRGCINLRNDHDNETPGWKFLKTSHSYLSIRLSLPKDFFMPGVEMTAFPISALVDSSRDVSSSWSIFLTAYERGYDWCDPISIPGLMIQFKDIYAHWGNRNVPTITYSLSALWILVHSKDPSDRSWAYKKLMDAWGISLRCTASHKTFCSSAEKILWYAKYSWGGIVSAQSMINLDKVLDKLRESYKFNHLSIPLPFENDKVEQIVERLNEVGFPDHSLIALRYNPLIQCMLIQHASGLRGLANLQDSKNLWASFEGSPVHFDLSRLVSRKINLDAIAHHGGFIRHAKGTLHPLVDRILSL